MRPTASSASKVHDKSEIKSPPRRTPSLQKSKVNAKPKSAKLEKPATPSFTNGTANGTAAGAAKTVTPLTEQNKEEKQQEQQQSAGVSTPQADAGAQDGSSNAGLEATPAFHAETIR